MFFKCLLRHGVVRVFVSLCLLVLYGPFCHGALKLDISSLFTNSFFEHLFNLYYYVLNSVILLSLVL